MDGWQELWVEIVHLPRGRSRQGSPEWIPVLKGRDPRGLVRSAWAPVAFTDRGAAIRATAAYCEREGISLRSACVIPFPATIRAA